MDRCGGTIGRDRGPAKESKLDFYPIFDLERTVEGQWISSRKPERACPGRLRYAQRSGGYMLPQIGFFECNMGHVKLPGVGSRPGNRLRVFA